MNTIVSAGSLATAAAVSTLPPTALSAAQVDDTLARISEHRRLSKKIEEICKRMNRLGETIPEDRQKMYLIHDRGTDVGKHDDPRWTAVQEEYWAAEDAVDDITWSFCDRPPTSVEGSRAILAYAVEHEKAGWEWPDCRHYYTAAGTYDGLEWEDWRSSLMEALAEAFVVPAGGPAA